MSRGKGTLFALVAIGAMMASPVVAVTTSGAVAATDERAPEAVTDVTGFAGTDGVEITWALSASDFVRPSPTGADFTSGGSFSNVTVKLVARTVAWRGMPDDSASSPKKSPAP